MQWVDKLVIAITVAPVRERGLKWFFFVPFCFIMKVAPVRERGVKYNVTIRSLKKCVGRSREGAWIEITL